MSTFRWLPSPICACGALMEIMPDTMTQSSVDLRCHRFDNHEGRYLVITATLLPMSTRGLAFAPAPGYMAPNQHHPSDPQSPFSDRSRP